MAKRKEYVTALLAALKEYGDSLDAEGNLLVNSIRELLANGVAVSKAVDMALKQGQYTEVMADGIANSIYKMALAGYGISTSIRVDAAAQERIIQSLSKIPWSHDKMTLSARLHGTEKAMRQAIVSTIQTSLNKQQGLEKLSMQLYDGYNTGKHVIQPAELPKYLQRLKDSARRVATGNVTDLKEFNKALAAAKSNMDKITNRNAAGTPNTDLMLTYKKLFKEAEAIVKATGKLNTIALDQAVWAAVQEKSRFYADRIARSENSRAWFDGFILETQNDELVFGYRWVLSNRHKYVPFDQCDVCANMDVGYGKGIYPKDKVPSIPRHPHCMCSLEVVYFDEVDISAPFTPDGARKYIDTLTDQQRKALFGIDGAKAYERGTDWQKLLRGWSGFENPASRLNKAEFADLQPALESSPPEKVASYQFYGDQDRPGTIEKYKNINIVCPTQLNKKVQPLTIEDVKEGIDSLPDDLRQTVKEIQIVDYRNPHDEYWEKTYRIKNFFPLQWAGMGALSFLLRKIALWQKAKYPKRIIRNLKSSRSIFSKIIR